jgi:hypothetical protein
MKWYKIQNRSQKNSHSCVPVKRTVLVTTSTFKMSSLFVIPAVPARKTIGTGCFCMKNYWHRLFLQEKLLEPAVPAKKLFAPAIPAVLIHLDQHFIERGPCCSERERTLEILDLGHIVRWISSPTLFKLIRTAQGHMPLSLPPSNRLQSARKQTEGASGGHILLI